MRLERTSPTEEALELREAADQRASERERAAGVSAAAGSAAAAGALGGVAASGAIAGPPAGPASALAGVVIGAAVGAVGSGAIGLAISHQHRDAELRQQARNTKPSVHAGHLGRYGVEGLPVWLRRKMPDAKR
jgi:hypothetical protein